jgi:hypothetical protein
MSVPLWWEEDGRERFWLEITNRDDLGADLKAPQQNERGEPYWSYELIRRGRARGIRRAWRVEKRRCARRACGCTNSRIAFPATRDTERAAIHRQRIERD